MARKRKIQKSNIPASFADSIGRKIEIPNPDIMTVGGREIELVNKEYGRPIYLYKRVKGGKK